MGNVGSISAKLLAEEGAKIIAVSDVSCAIYNENGLDISGIYKYLDSGKNLLDGYTGDCKRITNAELLELPCDILIPAALENQITAENADRIKAKIVIEAANGPTSVEADEILNKKASKSFLIFSATAAASSSATSNGCKTCKTFIGKRTTSTQNSNARSSARSTTCSTPVKNTTVLSA